MQFYPHFHCVSTETGKPIFLLPVENLTSFALLTSTFVHQSGYFGSRIEMRCFWFVVTLRVQNQSRIVMPAYFGASAALQCHSVARFFADH